MNPPRGPLSPSLAKLREVVGEITMAKAVTALADVGVTQNTLRWVVSGRFPPFPEVQRRMWELWQVPLDGWQAPPPGALAHRPPEPPQVGVAVPVPSPTVYVLAECPTQDKARRLLDSLRAAGVQCRTVLSSEIPTEPKPTPAQLEDEAVAALRGVVRAGPNEKGRHSGEVISAARTLLDHVHTVQPKLIPLELPGRPLTLEERLAAEEAELQ